MSPSQEFYQSHVASIGPNGRIKEQEDNDLLSWSKAQLPLCPYMFVAKIDVAGKELWGFINVLGSTLGCGALRLPVTLNSEYKKDYPGFEWVVNANKEAFGDSHDTGEIVALLGLEHNQKYGECRVSTSATGSPLKDYPNINIDISRSIFTSINGEHWREFWGVENKIRNLPEQTRQTLSAAGVATVIHRDIPSITITPMPYQILESPVRPK